MEILIECLQTLCLLGLAGGLYLQLRFDESADEQSLTRQLQQKRHAAGVPSADEQTEIPVPSVTTLLPDR